MAQFTVRVELHGADSIVYDLLHTKMDAAGFKRYIPGVDSNGVTGYWKLPTAEYDYMAEANATQVRDLAKILADSIKAGSWVLVTEVANRSWTTAKI